MASSPSGAAVAVWEQDSAAGVRIVASVRSAGGVWGAQHPISALREHSVYSQQVAMDRRGGAVAVWQDAGRIQVARHPAGGTWSAARPLSVGSRANFPEVAMSPRGATVVVWQKHLGRHDVIQVVRRPDGGRWSAVRTLPGSFGDAGWPQVAVDARGRATVVWERDWADGGRSAVFVARRSPRGVWSTPRQLSPTGHPGVGPLVAMNRRGDAVVTWMGRRSGIPGVQGVVRHPGGAWSKVGSVSRAVPAASLGGVALDASGTVAVAWTRWDGSAQRVRATTKPADGRWGSGTTVSPAGVDVSWSHVAVGGGVTTVTWESSVIQGVQRTSGVWGPVIPLSGGVDGSAHQLTMDSAGQAVVVWKQFDGTVDRVMVTSLG